jgi:ABC-2 type transport system permease protein
MRIVPLVLRSFAQARYVLLGCWALLCLLQLVTVGQAAALEAQQAFGRLTELVPAFVQRGLGAKALLLSTFKGAVAFGYFHPVICLLVSLLAAYLTTELAHEVEAGLVDVELARPLPRHVLVTRSLIAAAAAVGIAVSLMALGTWAGLRTFGSPSFDAPSRGMIANLIAHLAAVAAVFGALGLAIAAGARRWSTAFFGTALAAVVLYLVDFLAIGWPSMRPLSWLSPFQYFPALSIIAGEAAGLHNLAILGSTAALLTAVAYVRFEKRDL